MKKFTAFILTICLFVLCGCNSAENETTETTGATETTTIELTAADIYDTLLSKLSKRLSNIIVDDTHLDGFNLQEGMGGIAELTQTGDTELLNKFGYAVIDINEDGIEELLICQVDEEVNGTCSGTKILCAYTVYGNEAVLLFEGNSEDRYYYLNDAKFYNETSADEKAVYILPAESSAVVSETLVGDVFSRIQELELTSLAVFYNIKIANNSIK